MFTGVAAHLRYSAIFCAGLVYLLGRPAEPRRVGRGLLLMVIPLVLHGLWNSLQVFAGANPVAQLALPSAVIVVAPAIVAWVFSMTVMRERELMRAVMAPEVARRRHQRRRVVGDRR
jgi:protease PrsW